MPRPQRARPHELQLQRQVDTLQIKLLQLNAAMRLKVVYAQRLEHLVCERNKRVDSLYGLLEQARQQNIKLDQENEHLVEMVRLPPPL